MAYSIDLEVVEDQYGRSTGFDREPPNLPSTMKLSKAAELAASFRGILRDFGAR